MRLLFVLFLLPSIAMQAQVMIEYNVIIEDSISAEQRDQLPCKIIMYINGQDVVVRGMWSKPPTTRGYQLYKPAEDIYYYCTEDKKYAYAKYFLLPTPVLLVDSLLIHVAGLPCKLAVTVIDQDTLPILYTDAFGIHFCQIAKVPGFALRYTKRLQGVRLTYEAYKFSFIQAPPEIFTLENRKIIEPLVIRIGPSGVGKESEAPTESLATRQWAMTIGRKPPKLRARSLDRTWINPKFCQGKVVVLHFSALNSFFAPNDPQWFDRLASLYAEHPDVLFIMMFRETEMDVRDRMRDFARYRFRIVTDADFYMNAMELYTLPTTIVINRFNRIGENVAGRDAEGEARLKRAIDLAITGGLKPQGID